MSLTTGLYLAHLNPLTNAHMEIISELREESQKVKVMPVVFRDGDREINSRSFPFTFEQRKEMLRSEFGDDITVTDDYTFFAPFKRYMPPLLAPKSWKLRRQILDGVSGNYFTYTGDKAEGYMLKIYRLRPKIGTRKQVSASTIKEKLYQEAVGIKTDWKDGVPERTARIIEKNWDVVKKFASIEDMTTRILGMKFPKEGY